MSLSNLVRVGRWWLNPRYVIKIEDRRNAAPPPPGPEGDEFALTTYPGETIGLRGEDAATLRRMLEGDGESPIGEPPNVNGGSGEGVPSPPRVLSGTSILPTLSRDDPAAPLDPAGVAE